MRVLLATLLILTAEAVSGETRVWLIGGGNTLSNSQGQIEENVRWLQRVLAERGIRFRTYFTSGTSPTDDVIYYASPQERDPQLERILRVFEEGAAYARRTKRNTLEGIDGTTQKDALLAALRRDLAEVGPADSVLMVYNGHGDSNFTDTSRNSLKLWGDGRLSVGEFGRLLDVIDARATVRIVMTQCYSGAFASAVLAPPEGTNSGAQRRCGYFAESDLRESEGCDLGINEAEFRDYTTYLMAALTGRTRLGKDIPAAEVDIDGSGAVSFDEAHYYTLKHGVNSDLPRSSREAYLEVSEPWYLRWNSFAPGSESSRYMAAGRHIARRDRIAAGGPTLVRDFLERRKVRLGLERGVATTSDEIKRMQSDLVARVIARFPRSAEQKFWHHIALQERDRIGSFVAGLDGYPTLVATQELQAANMKQLLTAKRVEAQAERVLWLNRMARLERYLTWLPAAGRRQLKLLDECEKGHL